MSFPADCSPPALVRACGSRVGARRVNHRRGALPLAVAGRAHLIRRRGNSFLCVASLFGLLGGCALVPLPHVDAHAVPVNPEQGGNLRVLHPLLLNRIHRLEARSARFRAAVQELREGGIAVYIGTPAQIAAVDGLGRTLGEWMAMNRVGEFAAVVDPQSGEVRALLVRVALDRIARSARRWYHIPLPPAAARRRSEARFEERVDAVLIHELWGHLVPVAESGGLHGRCADPRPGEPELESCVMRRENDLRRELGLAPRRAYELDRSRPRRE